METTTEKTSGAAVATRICAKPGCTTELGPKNRSGRCAPHFHWKPGKSRSAGNGHASTRSDGANGHAAESHGAQETVNAVPDLAGEFREDRLDRLILGFPLAAKAKIATAWLRGEI